MNWKATTVLALFTSACAFAQAGGVAGISGVVKDPSGSAVPNAKVEISTASRGAIRTVQTNTSGIFTAPALQPGPGYKVTVTASGFAPYELNEIDLQVGQNLNLTVPLAIGQTSTTIDVHGAAELLDDTKTDVSQVVGTRDIMNLPINGRRVDSFVLLTPGVTNDATFGLLTFRGVAGNNSFLLDGNDNTEQFYDENAGRTRIQSQISAGCRAGVPGGLGELLGGVRPRHGRRGQHGDQERHATNCHGTGFYFFRSTGFDARDTFAAFNPTGEARRRWRQPGRPDHQEQAVSTSLTRSHVPQVPDGGQLRDRPVW